jgi:hypothetical protein
VDNRSQSLGVESFIERLHEQEGPSVHSTYKKHIRVVPRELFAVKRLYRLQHSLVDDRAGHPGGDDSVVQFGR